MNKLRYCLAGLVLLVLAACGPASTATPAPTEVAPAHTKVLPTLEPTPALPTAVKPSVPASSTPVPILPPPTAATSPAPCEAGDPNQKLFPGHPYFHQVYRAFSSDGLSFTLENVLLLDHASVPDAVLRPNGETWVYFVNGQPGQHGIWAARETDTGTWVHMDCVRLDGVFNGNAVDPDVMLLPDGRYRLFYYEGFFVGPPPASPEPVHPIFSAVSEDGLNFTVERELITVENVTDPSVVQRPDGSWLMALSQGSRTLLAASSDGYNFELTGVVVEAGGVPELTVLPNGQLRLFVTGRGIESLISDDGGQIWTQEPGERIFVADMITADPSLVAMPDGTYTLFYKVQEMPSGLPPGEGPSQPPPPSGEPGQPPLPPPPSKEFQFPTLLPRP